MFKPIDLGLVNVYSVRTLANIFFFTIYFLTKLGFFPTFMHKPIYRKIETRFQTSNNVLRELFDKITESTQCGHLTIFLALTFYVKLILLKRGLQNCKLAKS